MPMTFFSSFAQGILFGLGLFAAFGPKDIFVIRYSLAGGNLPAIILFCAGADALLILLGIQIFTWVGAYNEGLLQPIIWAGALYLCWMGLKLIKGLWGNNLFPLPASEHQSPKWRKTIFEGVKVALINPYAWLDTMFVIAPLAAHKPGIQREIFATGTICASLLWFAFLAFGVGLVRPLFNRAISWQIFDGLTAILLFFLAGQLLFFSS